jgi:hypothetical protein
MKRGIFRVKISDPFKLSWVTFSIISITILVFLSEWIQKVGIVSIPLGFRHIIILIIFIINWVIFGRPLRLNQYYLLAILLIFSYVIVAYLFVRVSILNYFLGFVFTFLFVLMFILGSNTKTHSTILIKIFKGLLIFFLLMSIGPISQGLFAGSTLRHIPGLFRELGAFGSSMNIGVIISLSLYIITGKKRYLYFAFFLSFGVFLTILKKSIFSNIIVWGAFVIYQTSARLRRKLIFYGIFFILLSLLFTGDEFKKDIKANVDYYQRVGPKGHVRLSMYVASINIAYDYFPFGSGLGTFCSVSSLIGGYSQIYIEYHVSEIGSNSQKDVALGHHTLLDTYWPHIVGELGFIGTLLFIFIWFFPLVSTYYIVHLSKDPLIRGLGFYIVLMILIMTNEGFTLYTPEIPSFVLLHSGIAGLCYCNINNSKIFI